MDLKNILPTKGPRIEEVKKYIENIKSGQILYNYEQILRKLLKNWEFIVGG